MEWLNSLPALLVRLPSRLPPCRLLLEEDLHGRIAVQEPIKSEQPAMPDPVPERSEPHAQAPVQTAAPDESLPAAVGPVRRPSKASCYGFSGSPGSVEERLGQGADIDLRVGGSPYRYQLPSAKGQTYNECSRRSFYRRKSFFLTQSLVSAWANGHFNAERESL